MQLRHIAIFCFCILSIFCSEFALAAVPAVPATPVLNHAAFSKIAIKWTAVEGATSYKIYRNDTMVATVAGTEYIDANLTAGTTYSYSIAAINSDGESSRSSVLSGKTLDNLSGDNAAMVQQIVDIVNPNTTTAENLLSTVQGTLNLLGVTGTELSGIDTALLQDMITKEYEFFNSPDTATAASSDTLEQIMARYYKNHSFMDLYLNHKLTELGESHWRAGKKEAAIGFYEKSLEYLPDIEQVVCNTLIRMAEINFSNISATSTHADIVAALSSYRNTLNRYFQLFPNGGNAPDCVTGIRMMLTYRHFQYFPQALDYAAYDLNVYNAAINSAQALKNNNNTRVAAYRLSQIQSWQLGTMNVSFADSFGNTATGTLAVKNVSDKNFVLAKANGELDERIFNLTGTTLAIPVYLGHTYDLTAAIAVNGGNPLLYTVRTVPHALGQKTTYSQFNTPVTEALADATATAEVHFVADKPTSPYNLKATISGNNFTLSWDWINPSSAYQFKEFQVYRGGSLLGTTTTAALANIPIESDYYAFTYTVKACDINGQLSPESTMLTVLPTMTVEEKAYYLWKLKYFGYRPSAKEEDPDGDGVTNWEEYLSSTNPTKAAPAKPILAEATFTKVRLQWNSLNGVMTFKIYRNGTALTMVNGTEFTDSDLTPNTAYNYQITAFDADGETDRSNIITVRTLAPLTGDGATIIQQVVDAINPSEITATNLISSVQGVMSKLTPDNTVLTSIDSTLVQKMVDRDFEMLNSTDTATDTSTDTLDQILATSFKNHTFMDLYINYKLSELAEMHWQVGKKEAALGLYDKSLNYLPDVESIVFNTLSRIGYIQLAGLTATSTHDDVSAAMAEFRTTMNRYFQIFPNGGNAVECKTGIYLQLANRQFNYFQQLLPYDNYDQTAFASALAAAQTVKTINNGDKTSIFRLARISAWQLGSMKVSFVNTQGTPVNGTLTVTNTSDKKLVLANTDGTLETRTFNLTGAPLTIPVYTGHTYDLTVTFPVEGGNPIVYTVSAVPHAVGQKTTYNRFSAPLSEKLTDTSAPAEVAFITERPVCPYNLKAVPAVDVFTLSWDWVTPSDAYQLKEFKVYRGGVEIGTTTTRSLANIPVNNAGLAYAYTVKACDTNDQLSAESPTITVIPPMTAEIQAYYAWKLKYFGTSPSLSYEDPDQDGLTNWQEFQLGTNPLQPPVANAKSTVANIISGLRVRYYSGTWSTAPNFESLTPLSTEMRTNISFGDNYGVILNSGLSDNLGMVADGYFDITVDGTYRFYMVSDDVGRLIIDGVAAIDMNSSGWHDKYADIPLTTGSHSIRVEYTEKADRATLMLYWSGPNFAQKVMKDCFWYTDTPSAALTETLAWQRDTDHDGISNVVETKNGTDLKTTDSDGDGLTDYEEIYIYHTNPNKADTDGDGIDDYTETKLAFSDPNKADFNGLQTELAAINGSAASGVSTNCWQKSGNDIYAIARNGWLEYDFTLAQAGAYVAEVSGTQYNSLTTQSAFDLNAYADGLAAGRRTLNASAGNVGKVIFFLPQLAAGTHKLKLNWNNVSSNTFLQINCVRILALGGADTNNNGTADWIDNRLTNLSEVTIPATSTISPVCIEGDNAARIDAITFSGSYTAPGETVVMPIAARAAKNRWYANIPLDPVAANTNLTVNFNDINKTTTQAITWTPTNVLTPLTAPILVRVGDSLKLTAVPTAANVSTDGTVTISVNGTHQTVTEKFAAYKFASTGSYTVEASFQPTAGGTPLTGSITVKAVPAGFNGTPYAILGYERSWSNPNIPAEAILESDSGLMLFRTNLTTGCNLAFYGRTAGQSWITARLGDNGPIMASGYVSILDCNTHKNDGYYKLIDTFSDGSKMIEGYIVLTNIPSDLTIKLQIATAGTTFEDGTTIKTLTAADFDANGICRYRMLKSATSVTATCHTINFYEGSTLVNAYRNW